MKRLVILISGRGSNLEAIARAAVEPSWPARVCAVLACRAEAPGLLRAARRGIPTVVVERRAYAGRAEFDAALAAAIDGFSPDLVVLAGFMRILGPAFVARYRGRLLNVHPSLLPVFPGLHTHQRALDAGVKLHGASVHFVSADVDHGPLVAQAAVPVLPGDDATSLAVRVLAAEHLILPRAVRWFVDGRLALRDGRAVLTPPEPQWLFIDEPAASPSEATGSGCTGWRVGDGAGAQHAERVEADLEKRVKEGAGSKLNKRSVKHPGEAE